MNDRPVAGRDDPVQDGALAARVRESMLAKDSATRWLGIAIEIAPGACRATMTVKPEMLNGHGSCHGGLIFTLADSAFAFACNSRNQKSVASSCHIDFLKPALEGDLLTAEAVERSGAGRLGLYDITVSNQRQDVIALFRGQSYRLQGAVVEIPQTP